MLAGGLRAAAGDPEAPQRRHPLAWLVAAAALLLLRRPREALALVARARGALSLLGRAAEVISLVGTVRRARRAR